MILHDTVPSEALVRVVKFHKETSKIKILFDTRSAKVTDVTLSSKSIGTEENLVLWKEHRETRCEESDKSTNLLY